MRSLPWPHHPFTLLLYLEWILLGIAVLTAFPTPFPSRRSWPPPDLLWVANPSPFGAFLCIAAIGVWGLNLPIQRSNLQKILFTALEFGLSWLSVGLGGLGSNSFSALLLVVVVRACLLFPWRGRLLVALLAFSSFGLRLLLGIQRFFDPDFTPPARLYRPLPRSISEEQIQTAVINLTLNSTLLFGLVLVFVLLMVGAILTERQSRDRLASANERLRRYALLIENQATLQERNRIAREIHDSVGHTLTAQSIQLENVALWLPENLPRAASHLQTARVLGKEALQNVRQSVATMRQPPLQAQSLPEALAKLLQDFERTTGVGVTSHIQLALPLPTEMAITLYRIVQEATTNIAKHSQATQVNLDLTEQANTIALVIQDNGCGFDPAINTTGFGLQSMRERSEAFGGTFAITSQLGQGCYLSLTLPRPGAHV
jgi:signal transduction histidine kinase